MGRRGPMTGEKTRRANGSKPENIGKMISDLAKLTFARFQEHCNVTGHLKNADEIAVAMLWQQIRRYVKWRKKMGANQDQWDQKDMVELRKIEETIHKGLQQFGMTIYSRARFGPTRAEEVAEAKQESAFEARARFTEELGIAHRQ